MKISDSASQIVFKYLSAQNTNSLSVGDIFTGRILSVNSGYLLMQLSDGSEISAQVKSDVLYNAGDILKLKVIDKQQQSLIVTEIEQHSVPTKLLEENRNNPINILKSMNLPITKARVEIINAIVGMGVNPTAELIEKALNIIERMHIEDPRHAVFMTLNRFENKEQYYKLIKELDEGIFHFTEELNDLISMMEQSEDKSISLAANKIRTTVNDALIKNSEAGIPKVDQWINELDRELSLVSEYVTNSTNDDSEKILQTTNKLQTAIRFFNDILGYEMFVQLPLLINKKQANAELYITKRKGRKGKITAQDFSLFLSLSTENIGELDIFVHVKNKNVMIKVSSEDDEFKQLIMDEYKVLYGALKDKGYNLFELGFMLEDEKLSIFNADKKEAKLSANQTAKIDIKV